MLLLNGYRFMPHIKPRVMWETWPSGQCAGLDNSVPQRCWHGPGPIQQYSILGKWTTIHSPYFYCGFCLLVCLGSWEARTQSWRSLHVAWGDPAPALCLCQLPLPHCGASCIPVMPGSAGAASTGLNTWFTSTWRGLIRKLGTENHEPEEYK